jgi:hypothetical protein
MSTANKIFFWSHQRHIVNASEVEAETLSPPSRLYICYNVSTMLHSLGILSAYK